jgi:hypothetical protein
LAPPHLAAICPWEGACDYYREHTHSGGVVSEFLPSSKPYQIDTVQYGNEKSFADPNIGRRVSGDEVISEEQRRVSAIDIGRVLNHDEDEGAEKSLSGEAPEDHDVRGQFLPLPRPEPPLPHEAATTLAGVD